MKAKISWLDGVSFVAESGSGHAVVLDGSPEFGGRNIGSRPMEMVLVGLGSCSAFDIVAILNKSRQPFTDVQVELEAERADSVPAVFTKIAMNFTITGQGLDQVVVDRAVKLSVEKYCSVAKMLRDGGVVISYHCGLKNNA